MPLAISTMQGLIRDVVLASVPHGGQRTARRNAWASMSADAAMARARREAAAAVAQAALTSSGPVRSAR